MRRRLVPLIAILLVPGRAEAQAPAWSDLWRVADGTMTRPAALADGPTGAFWNPAGVLDARGPSAGIEVYQTPEVMNVTAILVGAALGLGERIGIGVLAGRASVSDLIRTSSSPLSDGPEIPVYAQYAGAAIGLRVGPLHAGASATLHDARLDGTDEGGLTVDAGLQLRPLQGLRLGVASHLGDPIVTGGPASGITAGAEYGFVVPAVAGLPARVLARYGLTAWEASGGEHLASAGLLLGEQLLIDAGAIWSTGYGTGAWQPVLGIAFRAGPFRVGIARGSGASGVGATYRVTLGVGGGS